MLLFKITATNATHRYCNLLTLIFLLLGFLIAVIVIYGPFFFINLTCISVIMIHRFTIYVYYINWY